MEAKINEIFNLLNSENKINELSLYEGVGGQLLFRYIAGKQKLYLEDDLNSIILLCNGQNTIEKYLVYSFMTEIEKIQQILASLT